MARVARCRRSPKQRWQAAAGVGFGTTALIFGAILAPPGPEPHQPSDDAAISRRRTNLDSTRGKQRLSCRQATGLM